MENKLVPSISKIHDFEMTPEGAKVLHVCKVGPGQSVKFAPVKVDTYYKAEVMNKEHLEENGQPKRRTTIPIEKVGGHANSKRRKTPMILGEDCLSKTLPATSTFRDLGWKLLRISNRTLTLVVSISWRE